MKILYWTALFLPHIGGIETFSFDLIPALQAKGHDVTVLTSPHVAYLLRRANRINSRASIPHLGSNQKQGPKQ
jgi:hypothetical protein